MAKKASHLNIDLESNRAWRLIKVATFIGLGLLGILGLNLITDSRQTCEFEHMRYISRNDVRQSFFAAPPQDCDLNSWPLRALANMAFDLLVLYLLFRIVKWVSGYIIYGNSKYEDKDTLE